MKKPPRRKTHAPTGGSPELDRLPPHSIEAEQGVLGCILLEPGCFDQAARVVRSSEAFYDLRHQTVWKCMQQCREQDTKIDMICIVNKLKRADLLDGIGGMVYLTELPDKVPSAANLPYYLEILMEQWTMRKALSACSRTISQIYDGAGRNEVIEDLQKEVAACVKDTTVSRVRTARECMLGGIDELEMEFKGDASKSAISTGFADMDALLVGCRPGEVVVIAARPGVGKTTIVMNIVDHASVEHGKPCGVFNFEMSGEDLMNRMASARSGVNINHILQKMATDEDFKRFTTAAGRLAKAPVLIDDQSGQTITEVCAKARLMHAESGIEYLVVDYLQRLRQSVHTEDKRHVVIGEFTGQIKSLARELNIPIFLLSQLGRGVDKKRPHMSDLSESASIEQDADKIILLWLEDHLRPEEVRGNVAKNRRGRTGDFELVFQPDITRFRNASKIKPEDIPEDKQRKLPWEE